MSVNKILEQVANEPGKNAKIAILASNKNNTALMEAVRLAYEPTINFYLKKIPEYAAGMCSPQLTLTEALTALGDLSSRKVTGDAARNTLGWILSNCSVEDAMVIAKVIGRDLRAGFTDGTANKVWKDLIPEYPYMRCSLPKAVKMHLLSWKDGVYSQLKADGMFANVNLDAEGDVQITSRSGTVFPLGQFADLVAEVKTTFGLGTQSHGELLVMRRNEVLARQIGNGILNKVSKGGVFAPGDTPFYMVWDNIPLTSVVKKGVCNIPYKTRYAGLCSAITSNTKLIVPIPTRIVHSMAEALVHYREMLADGLEGTIIKHGDGIWKDGTSKEQIKLKLDVDVDLKIVGFTAGKGKNEVTFGSITCQTSDGLLEVGVSGFPDIPEPGVLTRAEIWAIKDDLVGTIMTVKSNGIMPATKNNPLRSLFLPRFEEFRTDKTEADSMERVQEQFDNAVK
jgi:DNA ligase-1